MRDRIAQAAKRTAAQMKRQSVLFVIPSERGRKNACAGKKDAGEKKALKMSKVSGFGGTVERF
jgi:ABC-type hemin transport system substrate-binding protein